MGEQIQNSRLQNDLTSDKHCSKPLKFLASSQIEMIDEALEAVGPFGEVQLIVEKGRLRFVITKNSHDVLQWHTDSIRRPEADAPEAEQRPKTPRQSP